MFYSFVGNCFGHKMFWLITFNKLYVSFYDIIYKFKQTVKLPIKLMTLFCLSWCFTSKPTIFQSCWDIFLGWTSTKQWQLNILHKDTTTRHQSDLNPTHFGQSLVLYQLPPDSDLDLYVNLKDQFWTLTSSQIFYVSNYSKTCVKGPLKWRPKIGFQDRLSLNAGQKYCRMLQGEHSAIFLISLSYHLSLRLLFCLLLSGRLRKVLLYLCAKTK